MEKGKSDGVWVTVEVARAKVSDGYNKFKPSVDMEMEVVEGPPNMVGNTYWYNGNLGSEKQQARVHKGLAAVGTLLNEDIDVTEMNGLGTRRARALVGPSGYGKNPDKWVVKILTTSKKDDLGDSSHGYIRPKCSDRIDKGRLHAALFAKGEELAAALERTSKPPQTEPEEAPIEF